MTDRYLTDEDRDALVIAVDFRQSASDVLNIVESLIRRHRAAAWEECFESGTPWINPYTDTPGG